MPGHLPYRGEVRPKLYGHPSPPKPHEKAQMRSCGCGAVVVGICVIYFALIDKTNIMGYVLVIYFLFWVIAFFAMSDLKKIKMITPDIDEQPRHGQLGDDHSPSLAIVDDDFNLLEWPYRFISPRKSKDGHDITLQKQRMKNHGHTMSKHHRK